MWQNSKFSKLKNSNTLNVTKLKTSKCEEEKKEEKCDKTKKLKLQQNSLA